MKRSITAIFVALLACYIGLVVYQYRALFFSRFDATYWQDKYDHSQWRLPLSTRTIGDDGLYLMEGYRLIRGGDPTAVNAEMPPVGKYAIGASVALFHNGYLFGLLSTGMLLVLVYLLTKRVSNPTVAAAATLLAATDPLITNQFSLTMLDSIQTVWLLGFLACLFLIPAKKRGLIASTAGVCVGLFAGTKFPVLAPILFVTGALYLWLNDRRIRIILIFTAAATAGYLLPYARYFALGHTLFDWVKVQKFMVSFYLHGNLTPTWGSAIVTMLRGSYQNIFSRLWFAAPQWSPVWALLVFVPIVSLISFRKDKTWSTPLVVIAMLALLFMVFFSMIPFWTRYLTLLLPLCYILAGASTARMPAKTAALLFAVVLIANGMSSYAVLFPTPEATVSQTAYNISHMFFQDVYEDMTSGSRTATDRPAFTNQYLSLMAEGEIEAIEAKPEPQSYSRFAARQSVPLTITYQTRNLGPFTEHTTLPIVLEDGRWRIPWSATILLNGADSSPRLKTIVYPAHRGTLRASDKKPIAEDIESSLVWVTQGAIDPAREERLFKLLEGIVDGKVAAVFFHERVYGNPTPTIPIPLTVIPKLLSENDMAELKSFPGVTLTPAFARMNYGSGVVEVGSVGNTHFTECCSLLYNTTTYDGISGAELKKNAALKGTNGGSLVLEDAAGNAIRTIIKTNKQDGLDVEP
jgi:hypothetical protein